VGYVFGRVVLAAGTNITGAMVDVWPIYDLWDKQNGPDFNRVGMPT
jgi:hypothetical protein